MPYNGYYDPKSLEDAVISVITDVAQTYIYKLNTQFYDLNYKVNYSKKGTRVKTFRFDKVARGTHTYVANCEYNNSLLITVDADDVEEYALENQISIDAATRLLLSHEVFHVLLGHFSEKYNDYNKDLLNIAGDLEINSYLNINHPGVVPEDFGFSRLLTTDDYYKKLLAMGKAAGKKISAKMKIKDGQGTPMPMPNGNGQSADSNSSENSQSNGQGNSDDQNDQTNPNQNNSNGQQANSSSSSSQGGTGRERGNGTDKLADSEINNQSSDTSTKSESEIYNEEIKDTYGIKLPEDVEINTATTDNLQPNENISLSEDNSTIRINQLDEIKSAIKKAGEFNKDSYKNFTLDGLSQIISKLVRKEKEQSIVSHGRENTYFKINNRRQSEFILPGKRLTGGATHKKFSNGLTVFIDVSGSTGGYINHDLIGVAYKLYLQGANIVYYRGNIVLKLNNTDPFVGVGGGGSTDIVNTIKEYNQLYGKLERVYVFTDGQDDFRNMGDVCDKYSVFFIDRNEVREVYNNNKPQTSGWGW